VLGIMDKPWKVFERKIAKKLGTTRVLQKGTKVPDVIYKEWKIDCKHRKNLALWKNFWEARQKYGEHTVLVAQKSGTKRIVVVMEWDDWYRLVVRRDG